MKSIFVDTNFWVAIINPKDQWHQRAVEKDSDLRPADRVTSELVLVEVLNYFSSYRVDLREGAAKVVRRIVSDRAIETVLHRHDSFLAGLALYESRLDKKYSLTDCISMNIMRERGIADVLTHDRNFAQEGFNPLL